jgi:acyl-coenzyme A synthetase/AMP-(fatty) acid ligase
MKDASTTLSHKVETRYNDTMIIFFTSGTTGNPKMVRHTYSYPISHYGTAAFVQDLTPDDIHWTISDTGWAKSGLISQRYYKVKEILLDT